MNAAAAGRTARSLVHKTAWSSLAAASVLAARFLATILTARRLGPAGAGRLAYLLWIQEVVATVVSFGMQSCVTRFVAEHSGRGDDQDGRELASWLYVRYLALSLLGGAAISGVGVQTWRPVSDPAVWIALGVCIVSQALGGFYTSWLAGRQEFERIARVNLVSSAVLVAAVAVGMIFWGVAGVIWGYAAGSALPAVLSAELLRPSARVSRETAAVCWKYAAFAWCAALVSACVWSRIEVFFLERYWGSRELAMFSVGLTLSSLASQGPMLLSTALMPHFAQTAGAGESGADRTTYARVSRLMAALLFPLSLGASSLMPALLPALYGTAFRAAVPNAMVLTASSALSLAAVGSALVYGSGRSWFIAASGVCGAILSLTSCAVVIPIWGAWGASLARTAVQTAMTLLGMWYIDRYLGCPAPFRALGKIMASAAVAAGCCYATVSRLPTAPALALGVPLAALTYIVMLRLTRALDPADAQPLRDALHRTPAPLSAPACGLVDWVAL